MKKKLLIGGLSAFLLFGGAMTAGASKSGTQPDDTIHLEDKKPSVNLSSNSKSTSSSTLSVKEAAKKALSKVKGTIMEVEKEMEHGRIEYKFEIKTKSGEADVRVDAKTGKITRVKFDD